MHTFSIALLIAVAILPILQGCAGHSVNNYAIHVYTRSDACGAAETWANYLGGYHQEDLKGTAVYGDPGLAEAVKSDKLGIGYNNINYAYDMNSGDQISGIKVIPIDINENGQIDSQEDFYSNKTALTQAIAQGLYPSPPAREENLVTKDEFRGISKEFVRWVLTEGQQYCAEAGYIALPVERARGELEKLGGSQVGVEMEGTINISGAWALYPMVVRWTEEFRKIYPSANFNVSAGGAGKGMTDALSGMVDIGMVSRGIYSSEVERGAFAIAVCKDAVVPVANAGNPVIHNLLSKGVKRQTFANIWISGNVTLWPDIIR